MICTECSTESNELYTCDRCDEEFCSDCIYRNLVDVDGYGDLCDPCLEAVEDGEDDE